MTKLTKALSVVALLLGLIGVVGCLAAIAGVWLGIARLHHTTENIFGKIDHSFLVVTERISQTANRVQESRSAAETIEQSWRHWAKKEVGQRLASRPDVEEKVEQLLETLGKADYWLERSTSSIEVVREVLSLGSTAGAPAPREAIDGVLEEIGTLRSHLAQAKELVERIGGLPGDIAGEQATEERNHEGLLLAARLLTALGSMDTRLEALRDRVSNIQEEVRHWRALTHRWILNAAIGISLLLAWMAAAQSCLCLQGWKGLREGPARRSRTTDPSLFQTNTLSKVDETIRGD